MKQSIILFLALFTFTLLNAQENGANKTGSLRIDILTPGISYEYQLKETQTLEGGINFPFSFSTGGNENSTDTFESGIFYFRPTLRVQYRNFFNRKKRMERGKSVYNNSGIFFGGHIGYKFKSIEIVNDGNLNVPNGNDFDFGAIFGVQKTWKNNLQLGINFGPGLYIGGSENLRFTTVGNFNFSYVILPKRKKKEK